MGRFIFGLTFCGVLLALCFLVACTPSYEFNDSSRPNVFLIVIDTLRADHVGSYGYSRATTPNIDRFFADGVRFSKAISSAPGTPPAMAALLTGRRPLWHKDFGIRNENQYGMGRFLPESSTGDIRMVFPRIPTMAFHFQKNGYLTCSFVANPFLSRHTGIARGFMIQEEFRGQYKPYPPASLVVEKAISTVEEGLETIAKAQKKQNLFMMVHLMDPHFPYRPEPQFHTFSKGMTATIDEEKLYEQYEYGQDEEMFQANNELMMARYDECILMADHYVGKLLNALQKKGLLKNAVVALVADHGEEFLEHGRTTHKNAPYRELTRVPMFFKAPGLPKGGTEVDALVRMWDVYPTLCELAGLPIPNDLPGKSMLPILRDEEKTDRIAYSALMNDEMIQIGNRKYFRRYPDFDQPPGEIRLFDLDADPVEKNNLTESSPKEAEFFEKKINAFREQILKSTVVPADLKGKKHKTDEKLVNQLKGLGYLN